MSSAVSLEGPSVLTNLPRPLDPVKGQYRASNVWSGAYGSKRRKRTELAVAIDGEEVDLYDIQAPKLVSSYAVDPQSSFTCAPFSVRQKGTGVLPTQRITYCSTSGSRARILGFLDVTKKRGSKVGQSAEVVTTHLKYDLHDSASPVVHLGTVPAPPSRVDAVLGADLMTVHKDGTVCCLAGDLTSERWRSPPGVIQDGDNKEGGLIVEYASLTDSETARKGLLRGRDDALFILDSQPDVDVGSAPREIPILVLVYRAAARSAPIHHGRQVQVLASRSGRPLAPSQTHHGSLVTLVTWALPDSGGDSGELPQASLHAASGTLQLSLDGLLLTYNLSGTVPKLLSRLAIGKTASSFLRLSNGLVLAAAPSELNVFDTQYQSVQATLPVGLPPTKSSRKRKHAQVAAGSSSSVVNLLSYFPSLRTVVGLSAGNLVGVHFLPSGVSHRRKNHEGCTLMDAMGRGIQTKSNLVPQPPPEIPRGLASFLSEVDPVHDGRWKDQVSKMDRYVDNEDVENFERIFAKAVGIGRDEANLEKWKNRRDAWKRENLPSNGIQPNGVGLPNGTGTHRAPDSTTMEDEISGFPEERPLPEWLWPSRDPTNRGQAFIDQRKVLYALRAIFTCRPAPKPQHHMSSPDQDQSENKLAMQIYPPNVFRWVLDNGFFSRANIQRALRKPGLVEQVLPGQVVQAIVDFDPDMTILLTVLLAPVHLEAADLWEAVRLLIRSLGYPDITDQDEALLLTNGDGALTNGDVAMALEKEEEAAEQEMQLAVSSLENGDVRARALTLALTKLHLIEPSLAAQSLRKTMTGAEMISLIHLLRVEMARDGWLSRYFNDDADLDDEGAGLNGGIMLISDLLNVTLDGIGAGGWVTRGDPVDADELVVALQGEVSAALEGVEEATYLDGLLSEMLHYGKSVTRAGNSSVNKNAAPVPGSIIVQSEEMESRMLPLGLKAEQPVSLTRVGAGGEIKKRTLRDIGRLKSMRVGKYSIERIVL